PRAQRSASCRCARAAGRRRPGRRPRQAPSTGAWWRAVLTLGTETAPDQVGCAIGGHERVLASFHAARGRRHAEILTPSIEFTCRQARVDLREVGVIAVDPRPGLFTGLRVGVAPAQAMAPALPAPVLGVSTPDLL